MYVCNSEIVQKANRIVAQCGTRDPKRIARELGIEVMYLPFSKQRGAYKVRRSYYRFTYNIVCYRLIVIYSFTSQAYSVLISSKLRRF